jgi:hypothetical protein
MKDFFAGDGGSHVGSSSGDGESTFIPIKFQTVRM